MSLEAYEALPEEKPYLEYWDGRVIQKAVPKRKHRRLQKRLVILLDSYERRNPGADSGPEGHVWFEGRGYRVPDVAYWRADKAQGDDNRSLPPTLAIELTSTGQSVRSQREKCRQMRANGVDVCWLIDPERRVAEVFEGERDGEVVATDGTLTSPLLPGLEVRLPDLWAELDRP
jgi:Uma2 family endonuclease